MSSEVCPFCGKSFKRLKTHLPHCKAAPNSKTPPSKRGVSRSPSPVAAGVPAETGRKVPVSPSAAPPPSSPLTAASPSTKKKKPKSADQLQAAASPPPPPDAPKKKTSLRELIEAAKSSRVSEGRPEEPRSFSPLRPRTASRTKTRSDEDSLKFVPAETKRQDAPKKTAPKERKAKVDDRGARPGGRDAFWVSEEDLTVRPNPGGGAPVSATLQNVKATLGRRPGSGSGSGSADRIRLDAALRDQLEPTGNREPRPQTRSRPPAGLLAPVPAPAPGRRLPGPVGAEPLQLDAQKQNTAEEPEAAVARRRLGQVKLRELPEWLAARTPGRPSEVGETLRRGWRWYYRRYIDVRKGGVAGVGMLLAGYCALSYVWAYPHTKLDRWRKYH